MHTDRENKIKPWPMSWNIKENPVNCFCSLMCYSSMIFDIIHEISSQFYCTEYITAWINNKKKIIITYKSSPLTQTGYYNAGSLKKRLVTTQISITKFYSE